MRVNGKEECAEGAKVTLFNAVKEKIGECMTDNYGDFKFDNLEENSGKYTLRIVYTGYDTKTIEVDLKQSVSIGTVFLERVLYVIGSNHFRYLIGFRDERHLD